MTQTNAFQATEVQPLKFVRISDTLFIASDTPTNGAVESISFQSIQTKVDFTVLYRSLFSQCSDRSELGEAK